MRSSNRGPRRKHFPRWIACRVQGRLRGRHKPAHNRWAAPAAGIAVPILDTVPEVRVITDEEGVVCSFRPARTSAPSATRKRRWSGRTSGSRYLSRGAATTTATSIITARAMSARSPAQIGSWRVEGGMARSFRWSSPSANCAQATGVLHRLRERFRRAPADSAAPPGTPS